MGWQGSVTSDPEVQLGLGGGGAFLKGYRVGESWRGAFETEVQPEHRCATGSLSTQAAGQEAFPWGEDQGSSGSGPDWGLTLSLP